MQRTLIVLLVLWGAALLATASMPHHETDGLFFGAIAKTIARTGDWLTLRYAPAPDWVVDKPPLTFWITAAFLEIGNESRAALRLWHSLATLGLAASAYAVARLTMKTEAALLAALLLGTMLQISYQSLTPQQDIPLALALAFALYGWLRYLRTGSGGAAAAAGACVGLGALTKGVAAPVMFAAVVVAHGLVRWGRDRRWPWTARAPLLAAAGAIAVAGPWFAYGALRLGRPFVETMFLGRSGVDRFFQPQLRPPIPYAQAIVAYLPMLAAGTLPWTALIPRAVAQGRDAVRDRNDVLAFCVVWFATILALLALSPGDKVYRYLVPALVPLAVLMSAALDRNLTRGRLAGFVWAGAGAGCLLLWLALLWMRSAAPATAALYWPLARPAVAAMTLAVIVAGGAVWARRPRTVVAVLAAGAVLMVMALQWSVRTQWDVVWPWPAMAAHVHRGYAPGDRVVVVGSGGPFSGETSAAAFYFNVPVEAVDDGAEFVRMWRHERVFAIVHRTRLERESLDPNPTTLIESPLGWRLVTNRPAGP